MKSKKIFTYLFSFVVVSLFAFSRASNDLIACYVYLIFTSFLVIFSKNKLTGLMEN